MTITELSNWIGLWTLLIARARAALACPMSAGRGRTADRCRPVKQIFRRRRHQPRRPPLEGQAQSNTRGAPYVSNETAPESFHDARTGGGLAKPGGDILPGSKGLGTLVYTDLTADTLLTVTHPQSIFSLLCDSKTAEEKAPLWGGAEVRGQGLAYPASLSVCTAEASSNRRHALAAFDLIQVCGGPPRQEDVYQR
jgi:hypothetical protein